MKKKVNILLLVFVLGLWGTVTYKYISGYWHCNSITASASQKNAVDAVVRQKDTFTLAALERDPFLNRSMAEPKPVRVKFRTAGVKKAPPKIISPVPFPQVGYFGYLKSPQHKELVLLKVNNRLMKLRAGESTDGLKVVKIHKDSVQVNFNGEARTIIRSNK